MKVAVLGGAGSRVPLIVVGLARVHEDVATDTLALWDVDQDRQRLVASVGAGLIQRYGVPLKIVCARTLEEALEGASFVIGSIRVGGAAGRVKDETIALAHGTLGQETVGPGGFAMALRTIPAMVEYAAAVERWAPDAWLLNFTNPVSIILQALLLRGFRRCIGICDTPREFFEEIAAALRISSQEAFFDYVGLNHLGWVRRVLLNGRDHLPELLQDPERLKHVYPLPLFELPFLQDLGMLPSEYVYFYYRTEEATEKIRREGTTRGQMIEAQERELFPALAREADKPDQAVARYEDYLARRSATYFNVETGQKASEAKVEAVRQTLYQRAAGYERIAVDVIRALRTRRLTVMPVDVANAGALHELANDDTVEVPCVIDGNGAHPLAVGPLPLRVRPLVLQVKEYERLTARAALQGSARLAVEALAANPLVRDPGQAQALFNAYRQAHSPWLDSLR